MKRLMNMVSRLSAPGLPGKVAPVYAGEILADVVPRLIISELSKLDASLLFA